MEEKDFEAIKRIAKSKNKKNVGNDGTDGRNYMTTYYAVLLKQKIDALNKMVEWRQDNIRHLSTKRKRQRTNDSLTL